MKKKIFIEQENRFYNPSYNDKNTEDNKLRSIKKDKSKLEK